MSDLDTKSVEPSLPFRQRLDRYGLSRKLVLDLCDALDAALAAEKRQHSERWFEKERAHKAEAAIARVVALLDANMRFGGFETEQLVTVAQVRAAVSREGERA